MGCLTESTTCVVAKQLVFLKEGTTYHSFENRLFWPLLDFEKNGTGVIYAKNKKQVLNLISGFWSYMTEIRL